MRSGMDAWKSSAIRRSSSLTTWKIWLISLSPVSPATTKRRSNDNHMSKQKDNHSDEFIASWDKLQEAAEQEQAEAAAAALAAWVEAQKAQEAEAWQDTTQTIPLWKK